MAKCRVVYKPDKSVVVIHYAPNSNLAWDQAFDRAMQGELKGLPYDDIEESELPSTREDRGAWEGEKGKQITINPVKAKQIKDARLLNIKIEEEKEKLAIASLTTKGEI